MSIVFSMIIIALGAGIGANLRWVLSVMLNSYFPNMPPGTLAANLLGAFLIGLAIPLFMTWPGFSPHWRLFFITGFLGALTTFSTFSAEVFNEFQAGRLFWAFTAIVVHVGGSLLMLGIGMVIYAFMRQLFGGGQ